MLGSNFQRLKQMEPVKIQVAYTILYNIQYICIYRDSQSKHCFSIQTSTASVSSNKYPMEVGNGKGEHRQIELMSLDWKNAEFYVQKLQKALSYDRPIVTEYS